MPITREQVADLRPGDVVEMTQEDWPDGTVFRGPIWDEGGDLRLGDRIVRDQTSGRAWESAKRTLTVVSRAPRPLYVNHQRAEPVSGDVVRNADGGGALTLCWVYSSSRSEYGWSETSSDTYWSGEKPWPRLRLLVDGATGQVVP